MNRFAVTIREWAGCAIAILLVVGTAAYALMRGSSVGANIHILKTAADSLNQTAQQAPSVVIDAGQLRELEALRKDYQGRVLDSAKLGLVVSQLSEEARKGGLTVVEIQPRRPRDINNATYPLFRVSVVGDYRRIATYMGTCKDQRIPARVVDFTIVPAVSESMAAPAALRADITVEAYAADDPDKEGPDGQA